MALEKTCRGRQHGADDKGGDDRKKERLCDIKDRDDADQQQGHQRKGNNLRATNNRRKFGLAVRQRSTGLGGKNTQLLHPWLACSDRCSPTAMARKSSIAKP